MTISATFCVTAAPECHHEARPGCAHLNRHDDLIGRACARAPVPHPLR